MRAQYRSRLIQTLEREAIDLIENDHGNYVIQSIINMSPAEESQRFCRFVEFSKQKCSSNVVECAIKHGDEATREAIVDELLQYNNMLELLQDQVSQSGRSEG